MGKCPFCAEEIKDGVLLCKHCNNILDEVPAPDPVGNKFFLDKPNTKKFELFILLFNIMVSSWSLATSQLSIDFSSQTKTLFCLMSIASGAGLIKLFIDMLPELTIFCHGFVQFLRWLFFVLAVLFALGMFVSGVAVIGATNFLLIFIIWKIGRDKKNKPAL